VGVNFCHVQFPNRIESDGDKKAGRIQGWLSIELGNCPEGELLRA